MVSDNFRLATQHFKLDIGLDFIYSVANPGSNTGLYLFVGTPISYTGSDSNVVAPNNSVDQVTNSYNNMLFGKIIDSDSIKMMTTRHDWVANTVYDAYSHTDANLFNKEFYSVVNAAAYYHVFKCLDNNNESPSTEPPNFSDTSAQDTHYQTADGYVWKYMYSIPKDVWNKFSTPNFIPVIPNANVSGNAVSGTIDIIKVENGGAYYSNYIEGTWNSSDIQVSGNTVLYGISNSASSVNGYYSNCIITIKEGKGKGQYREVIDYVANGSIKQITVNSAFTTLPDVTSIYAISPKVVVVGMGQQTTNVVARALVNAASSNSIYSIEILDRGVGYRAATASIANNSYVPVSNVAILSPIIPPKGGHGANAYVELGAYAIGVSCTLSNNESNTISTDNDFRQIGLLLNPLWSNLNVTIMNTDLTAGSNGTFLVNEMFLQGNVAFFTGNASVNTTSAVVTGVETSFKNCFSNGDVVVVKSGSSYFLSNVASVTNATYMTLASNCSFLNATANIGKLTISATGYIKNVSSSTVKMANVSGKITANSFLIGKNTYTVAVVNAISINGRTKNYNTFNQRTSYGGTLISGTFIEDEVVMQGNSVGYFHSIDTIDSETRIYLTNENGIFVSSSNIVGNTSGAIFSPSARYPGDFVIDSGSIIYLENITAVSRANNQSEVLKTIIEL